MRCILNIRKPTQYHVYFLLCTMNTTFFSVLKVSVFKVESHWIVLNTVAIETKSWRETKARQRFLHTKIRVQTTFSDAKISLSSPLECPFCPRALFALMMVRLLRGSKNILGNCCHGTLTPLCQSSGSWRAKIYRDDGVVFGGGGGSGRGGGY